MAQMRRRAMSRRQIKQIAIIGAGLAGAACANIFAREGYSVTVYEQASTPASGASGVPIALFAPSISSDDAPHSRLLRQGVHVMMDELKRLTGASLMQEGVDWAVTGVLERCIRADKKLPPTWLAPQDPLGLQSKVLGDPYSVRPLGKVQELFHGAAGWVHPQRLIAAWLTHPLIELKLQSRICDVAGLDADVVVVACGFQSPELLPSLTELLQPIRGQAEWGASPVRAPLANAVSDFPVNGMGHFIQTPDTWVAGATFQRDEMDLTPRAKDVDKNFEKLAILLPELTNPELVRLRAESTSWVGVRTAQKNRQPMVTQLDPNRYPNLWICTGLGSRGVSLAALCAGSLLASVQHSLALG